MLKHCKASAPCKYPLATHCVPFFRISETALFI
jgi:hypothetical protein